MNRRSLRFQLIVWYAGLLLGFFVVLGTATYLALKGYLEGALKENQMRRARQIAQLSLGELRKQDEVRVPQEIADRYAPEINNRFVRVTRREARTGRVLYVSGPPKDESFDPAELPAPAWSSQVESARKVPLPDGREMMLAAYMFLAPGGTWYLVESGAPLDTVQSVLRHWLVFLVTGLPLVALVAVGGGYVLVKRALTPVDQIAASAERISSQNLNERLPVPRTSDELQRLSLALNHMIQRLDEAFQYSRRFMADASHELRTPLTVLRGELESMVEEPRLATDLQARLGSALEEVERLAKIVEGLFAISRLDAGEAQAEWARFDLGRLVASTADQMFLLAEDKKIRVTCAAPNEVWVAGDRARLKQVVVNLLDNAIKYTPEGGTVSIVVNTQDSQAVLEVADTGIGIPPEALPRVFERFFRVDKARSRDQGGAGLGLSIVKSICAAHHGRVEASSVSGQGSRFRVELPLASGPMNNHQN
jgi:heavy metal sensor kinase